MDNLNSSISRACAQPRKSKALPWFRLYTEVIEDEKLLLLAFEDRWHFVALLCLKGKLLLDSEPDREMLRRKVAMKMGLTCAELENVVDRLARMGLIDPNTLQPLAWDERQKRSDTSAERTRQYRERKRASVNGGTMVSPTRHSDVLDIDTDTEKEREEHQPSPAGPVSSSGERLPTCRHSEVIDLFCKHLSMLPQPRKEAWRGRDAQNMRDRWRWALSARSADAERYATSAEEALAFFEQFFAYVATSDFLTGRSGKWTGCSLSWLMNESNFTKVMEGNYSNKNGSAHDC